MPELPILDNGGRLSNHAPIIVEAIKMYPVDEPARVRYLASFLANFAEVIPPQIQPQLIRILNAASSGEEILRLARRSTQSAGVACMVLSTMLRAAVHHPEYSIDANRTFWALSQAYPKEIPSVRSCWRLWKQFRPVAHLSMATDVQLEAYGFSPKNQPSIDFLYANFYEFLGLAEFYRRLAVERRVLSFEEAWRVPDSLEVPQLTIDIQKLSEPMLNALASYVPPHGREGIEE